MVNNSFVERVNILEYNHYVVCVKKEYFNGWGKSKVF